MEENAGMVQSSSEPFPAARSNHTQADHIIARGNLPRHTPFNPGIEHPHVCEDFPHRRLRTHRGVGQVGGAEITGA